MCTAGCFFGRQEAVVSHDWVIDDVMFDGVFLVSSSYDLMYG